MLSRLAALLATWAAIYALLGVYYCLLHIRRREDKAYLAYGVVCAGFALWSGGAALRADAIGVAAEMHALRLQYVGGYVATSAFVDFGLRLAKRSHPRVLAASYLVGGFGAALAASGLIFEPGLEGRAHLTVIGVATAGCVVVFSAWTVYQVARATREQPDLRAFVFSAALATVAGAIDSVGRYLGHGWFLLEHVALLPVLTVSVILQRRFLHAADELGARSEQLERTTSDLREVQQQLVRKEQLAAVGELSAVIAHEVRNPLAIIKNAVSSLRRTGIRKEDRGVLLTILDEEVDRLGRLVRDLLAYARPVAPRERPVEIRPIVEQAVDAARKHHEDPDSVEVEIDVDDAEPIRADPDLLGHALTSVATNALQAMPDGGTLSITATDVETDDGLELHLEMTDDGIGMESLILAKATDPFFTTRAAGTGLGLAIVERVVRNHGGRVVLESGEREGTTVCIVLPRTEAP